MTTQTLEDRMAYLARQIVRATAAGDRLKAEQYIGRFDEALQTLALLGWSGEELGALDSLLDDAVDAAVRTREATA